MKALITGSEGFVGKSLKAELINNGYEVIGIDIISQNPKERIDLLNSHEINDVIASYKPDAIFHLAGVSTIPQSWDNPQGTIALNTIAAVNIFEAVKDHSPNSKILVVGSSVQYGNLGERGKLVSEEERTIPTNPYAVSKNAQEEMAKLYVQEYGLHICMTRSFNHAGAGQRESFALSSFAANIVRIEKGLQKSIRVGNLDNRRDFTHVKDVARAYRLIIEKGQSGEIYNVGSGTTYNIGDILRKMIEKSTCDIVVEQDGKARESKSEMPVLCCNNEKLKSDTGWEPEHSMSEIIDEVLEYYRKTIV